MTPQEAVVLASELGIHDIAASCGHALALCAFVAPTANSYHRLVPGFEAPVKPVYSSRNRSAAVRMPIPPHST